MDLGVKRTTLKYKGGYKFRLDAPFNIELGLNMKESVGNGWCGITKDGTVWGREGYNWNGANKAPDLKCVAIAVLVHDIMYQLIRLGLLDMKYRKIADKVLVDLAVAGGMWWIGAILGWCFVRIFGYGNCCMHAEPEVIEI